MVNPIALSIPVFFVLIGLEVLVARWQGVKVYRFADAVTDLSCGIGQQVTGVFVKALTFGVWVLAWEHLRLFDLPASPAVWIGTFVVVDAIYYAWHRFTHEVNIGWATHVVHHQSEDYNLAVALRQSMTSSISSLPFYLPLAVAGVPPIVFATCSALNTLYQFWIHTETVGRIGPLEAILNTPSHHRVHHAVNPGYLDKNYAGVFIVWDRLFGTFEPEVAEPVYGTVKPLRSFNPLWANLAWFDQLVRDSLAAGSWRDRLRVWLAAPGWRPDGLPPLPGAAHERRADQVKYDPSLSGALVAYVAAWFVPVAVGTTGLLLVEDTATWGQKAALAGTILLTTVAWGGLFERRRWAVPLELARLAVVATLASVFWPTAAAVGTAWLAAAVSAVFVVRWARVPAPAPAERESRPPSHPPPPPPETWR